MKPFVQWNGIRVFVAPIDCSGYATSREAEQAAVERLVRMVVADDAVVGHDAAGAPFIVGNQKAWLSISHGAGRAVIAVAERRMGIDIEAPRSQLKRVESKFRNANDSSALSLLELWTAKEAVFKAAGVAELTIGQIAVCACNTATVGQRKFDVRYFPLDGALIALASERIEQTEDVGAQGVDNRAQ